MSKFDGMMNQHKFSYSLSEILTLCSAFLDQYSSDDEIEDFL